MKQILPPEFKEGFDIRFAGIDNLYKERDKLKEGLPPRFSLSVSSVPSFDFDSEFIGWWMFVCVLSVFSLIFTCGDKFSHIAKFPLSIFVLSIIWGAFFIIRNICKKQQQALYNDNVAKWKILKPKYDELQEEIDRKYRFLRKYTSDVYKWIKVNRNNLAIDGTQLRRLSYYHNQYIDKNGKYSDTYNWGSAIDIIYSILFEDDDFDTEYAASSRDYYGFDSVDKKILDSAEESHPDDVKQFEIAYKKQYKKTLNEIANKKNTNDITSAIITLTKQMMHDNLNWLKDYNFSDNFIQDVTEVLEIKEQKKLAHHTAFEGRIKSSDKTKIKQVLGYDCAVCGKNMGVEYGEIGKGYIELHHKIPYSQMKENDNRILTIEDFCVLCPSCHRMIHKLDNADDIELLKSIIALNKKDRCCALI